MEILAVLSVLRRRRLVVALGLVLAVAVGVLVSHHFRASSSSGTATARVLVDTEQSQLVTAAPDGSENLMDRASLLADTLATDRGMALVARAAHLPAREVIVYDPTTLQPVVATPMALGVAEAAAPVAPYLVAVTIDPELPVVSLEATAPSAAGAARVANAAVAALRRIATPPPGRTPPVRVEEVVPTHALAVAGGHGSTLAAVGGIVFFGFWCFMLVVASGLHGAWRRTLGPALG